MHPLLAYILGMALGTILGGYLMDRYYVPHLDKLKSCIREQNDTLRRARDIIERLGTPCEKHKDKEFTL